MSSFAIGDRIKVVRSSHNTLMYYGEREATFLDKEYKIREIVIDVENQSNFLLFDYEGQSVWIHRKDEILPTEYLNTIAFYDYQCELVEHTSDTCICSRFDLVNRGCTCGCFAHEQVALSAKKRK